MFTNYSHFYSSPDPSELPVIPQDLEFTFLQPSVLMDPPQAPVLPPAVPQQVDLNPEGDLNTPERINFDPDGILDAPDSPGETSDWALQIELEEEELQFDMEPHIEQTIPLTPEVQTDTTNVPTVDSHEEPMDVSSPTPTLIGDTSHCTDIRSKPPDPATIGMSESEKQEYHHNLRVEKYNARAAKWSKKKEPKQDCKRRTPVTAPSGSPPPAPHPPATVSSTATVRPGSSRDLSHVRISLATPHHSTLPSLNSVKVKGDYSASYRFVNNTTPQSSSNVRSRLGGRIHPNPKSLSAPTPRRVSAHDRLGPKPKAKFSAQTLLHPKVAPPATQTSPQPDPQIGITTTVSPGPSAVSTSSPTSSPATSSSTTSMYSSTKPLKRLKRPNQLI